MRRASCVWAWDAPSSYDAIARQRSFASCRRSTTISIKDGAVEIGKQIAEEDGASAAADIIVGLHELRRAASS
jgi:hypothetical protein